MTWLTAVLAGLYALCMVVACWHAGALAGRACAWLFGLHGPGCQLGWALARAQLDRARSDARLAELTARLAAERHPGRGQRIVAPAPPPSRPPAPPPPPPPYQPVWAAIVPMEGGRVPRSWRRRPPDPGWDPGAWRDTDWARGNGAGR